MSLYNQIAEKLSRQSLAANLKDGLNNATNPLKNTANKALGGGNLAQTATRMAQSMGANAVLNSVSNSMPLKAQNLLNTASGAVGDAMLGNFEDLGFRLIDSGLIDKYLTGQGGTKYNERFKNTPNPLLGGITPKKAFKIIQQTLSTKFAKKNLFLIEISSNLLGGNLNMPQVFNMFVTEVEYSPYLAYSEKLRIGGAVIDVAQGVEPVELRLTSLDDANGSIKKWFAAHHKAAYNRDGTVNPPLTYAVKIKIFHSTVTKNALSYQDLGLFRPANLDASLSRREGALQELQLTFSQIDTFLIP